MKIKKEILNCLLNYISTLKLNATTKQDGDE